MTLPKKPVTVKSETHCPTCRARVKVVGRGKHRYVPLADELVEKLGVYAFHDSGIADVSLYGRVPSDEVRFLFKGAKESHKKAGRI